MFTYRVIKSLHGYSTEDKFYSNESLRQVRGVDLLWNTYLIMGEIL